MTTAMLSRQGTYLNPNLLVDTLLLLLYLLLQLLDGGGVWCRAVCLENLDIPSLV